jgi:hypothetical protein
MTFLDLDDSLLPQPQAVPPLGGSLSTLNRAQAQTLFAAIGNNWKQLLPPISFSQLDQAFSLWGVITLIIFSLAQCSSLNWTTQALVDAALTGIGIAGSARLTWHLACSERLRWVVCLWAVLMAGGMIATAYGIFCGVGTILINLCPLWLGVCALGYLAMGVGLRSRCFTAASVVHGAAIADLALHPSWQFLTTGWVIALTLFFFSLFPWDMRAEEAEEFCGIKPNAHKL